MRKILNAFLIFGGAQPLFYTYTIHMIPAYATPSNCVKIILFVISFLYIETMIKWHHFLNSNSHFLDKSWLKLFHMKVLDWQVTTLRDNLLLRLYLNSMTKRRKLKETIWLGVTLNCYLEITFTRIVIPGKYFIWKTEFTTRFQHYHRQSSIAHCCCQSFFWTFFSITVI